jgi:hypothetical protein
MKSPFEIYVKGNLLRRLYLLVFGLAPMTQFIRGINEAGKYDIFLSKIL